MAHPHLLAAGPAASQQGRPYTVQQMGVEGRTEVGLAAAKGDKKEMTRLLTAGASAEEPDEFHDTPLHLAALFGNVECLKALLVDYHVPVDPINWEGWTPLACAVSRGHVTAMKCLLKSKANGTWTSPLGWTLMHVAAWYNQEATVEWLAQHGAATAAETLHGCRPFDMTRPGATRRALYTAMANERRDLAG